MRELQGKHARERTTLGKRAERHYYTIKTHGLYLKTPTFPHRVIYSSYRLGEENP